MDVDEEIDDNVITTGLSMELFWAYWMISVLSTRIFGAESKTSSPNAGLQNDLTVILHVITDGDSGCVMISQMRTMIQNMIIVLPIFGDYCGIPFDFIRTFEGIINDKKPNQNSAVSAPQSHPLGASNG